MQQTISLHHGDCSVVLRTLPDNSVDAVVTDPPYGLSFMGKKWDYDVPSEEVWRECLRVLKPGGYLLAFAGTRTQHRMAVRIEDAGFEIRDMIAWVYGCLSDDTEILTSTGWVRYNTEIPNSLVCCFNVETGEFTFEQPTHLHRYHNEYPAYRILSDQTDQLVSRNHRVLIEREGAWVFEFAETLAQESEIYVPILESVSDVLCSIPNTHQRTSREESFLLNDMCTDEPSCAANETSIRTQGMETHSMCGMQEVDVETHTNGYDSDLFLSMQREDSRTIASAVQSQGTCGLDGRIPRISSDQDVRPEQSGVERWSHILSNTRELSRGQVRALPESVGNNGAQRRVCDGTSVDYGAASWPTIDSHRSCASSRSQSAKQRHQQSSTLSVESGTQVVRKSRASIKKVEYNDYVWCVTVRTGAFVARRNGKMFITGNSGFPKSLDVEKAIHAKQTTGRSDSPVAAQWHGWGTALKPALEPITVARKPLDGTVAENVLRYGTAALNIDGCRVTSNPQGPISPAEVDYQPPTAGRWPANLIHDGSDEVVSLFPSSTAGVQKKPRGSGGIWSGKSNDPCGPQYGDSGSAARFFYSPKASKTDRERGLEYEPVVQAGVMVDRNAESAGINSPRAGAGRTSGSKNPHPTVKPIALMRYLIRLVTPPNGVVLDPFMGSGTTGLAAGDEQKSFIGIERDDSYFHIAQQRLTADDRTKPESLF